MPATISVLQGVKAEVVDGEWKSPDPVLTRTLEVVASPVHDFSLDLGEDIDKVLAERAVKVLGGKVLFATNRPMEILKVGDGVTKVFLDEEFWPVAKYNPYHDPHTGRFTSAGGAGVKVPDRSLRAKLTYKPATREKQRIADHSEKLLSEKLGLSRTKDNDAFDLLGPKVAVEVKTLVDQKNNKITMHPESRIRKIRAARRLRAKPYTVVVDRRQRSPEFYFAKGVGSFRLSSMKKVKSIEELAEVLQ